MRYSPLIPILLTLVVHLPAQDALTVAADGTVQVQVGLELSGTGTITGVTNDADLGGGMVDVLPTSAAVKAYVDGSSAGRNRLINADGVVWQRASDPATAATYADAAYAADRWIVMTDAASCAAQRVDGLGTWRAIRLVASGSQRLGLLQKIEAAECVDLRGQEVVFGGRVRCSATTSVHMAVLEWSGTADELPSDPIAAWGDPATIALASGWSKAGDSSSSLAAGSVTELRVKTTLGPSFTNLAVLVWTEAVDAGATLDTCALRLCRGGSLPPYEPLPVTRVQERCWRFYQREHFGFLHVGQAYNGYKWHTTVPLFGRMRQGTISSGASHAGMLHNGNIQVKAVSTSTGGSLLKINVDTWNQMSNNGCYQLVISGWWADAEL